MVSRLTVNLGDMQTKHGHGEGSSPVLYGETLVVNWDHEGNSFVVALDKRSGEELWRSPRDEVTSWGTPVVVEHEGKPQVVISGTERVRGYDLASGDASPVAAADRVYVTDLEGVTVVISHSAEPTLLAQNRLNDRFAASAAIAGRELFLRGERYLYCIAEE